MKLELNDTKKFFLILGTAFLALFLGFFLAFYLLISQFAQSTKLTFADSEFFDHNIKHSEKIMNDINRQINRLNKDFELTAGSFGIDKAFNFDNSSTIKTIDNGKEYIITVNLNKFGNDEKNVKVDTKGSQITISAKYEGKKNDKTYNSSSFYQSLTLPDKINDNLIKRTLNGSYLTITIPKSKQTGHLSQKNIPNMSNSFDLKINKNYI